MFCQSQSSGDSCLQRRSLLSNVFFICKCYFVGYVCNYGISRWENISFFWRHWKFYVKTENGVFLPLKIVDSQTIANYNKTLKNHDKVFDDKWRFKHVKVVCCHNGVPRDRCGGKRPNQKVFPCQCPFFRVVFQPIAKYFTISSMCVEHKNYPMSIEDIITYQKKQ